MIGVFGVSFVWSGVVIGAEWMDLIGVCNFWVCCGGGIRF